MRRRALLLAGLTLALPGCGFRLRGRVRLPEALAVVLITEPERPGTRPSPLIPVLRRLLEANGVKVTDDPARASGRILLLRESRQRRILGTDAADDTRQYQLRYLVTYRVEAGAGGILQGPVEIAVERELVLPESDVLGGQQNERLVLRELHNEAAYTILRRLRTLNP